MTDGESLEPHDSPRQEGRREVFERGARALRNVAGTRGDLYGCPLCRRGFPVEALEKGFLTWEHVPSEAIGGKRLLLTCRPCNSTSGHSFDAAVAARAEFHRFFEALVLREGEFEGVIKLRMAGEELNVRMRISNGSVNLEVLGRHNDPAASTRFQESIKRQVEEGTWEGGTFSIGLIQGFHERQAKLGDLRTAFLASFAVLGYRYAFSRALAPVRQQLLAPDQEVLPKSFWTFLGWRQELARDLRFIQTPVPMIFARIDRQAVILPGLDSPADPWSRLLEIAEPGDVLHLTGPEMEWPSRLEMALDFP